MASRGTGLHVRCDVLAIYDCQESKILALRRRFYVIVTGNGRNSFTCMQHLELRFGKNRTKKAK